jgi:hypothetical protein
MLFDEEGDKSLDSSAVSKRNLQIYVRVSVIGQGRVSSHAPEDRK